MLTLFAYPTFWLKFERCTFRPTVWEFGAHTCGWGWAHPITRLRVPIDHTLTHVVCLLPFLSYLAGSNCVSATRPSGDTMTITAVEATASSSDNDFVIVLNVLLNCCMLVVNVRWP